MSQFNPNMSKLDLVSDFRKSNPNYNSMSVDRAYRDIVRKFPQYKLNEETVEYNPKDESGIVDTLGDVWKDGYNRSLQGMVYQMTQGKKKYDLSNYHPGLVSDIAAGVASFFQPLDFATTVAGGGLSGAATKTVVKKYVTKKLLQNGVKGNVASRAARMAVASGKVGNIASASAGGAGALGLYSGAGEALNEYISDGTITPNKVVKAGAKGALLGGMTGGTNAFLTQKGASVLTKTLTEVGGFGTVSPLLEGEAPTTEDYLHAGGMILGIKGVNQVAKKGFKELQRFKKEATKEQLVYEATPKELIKVESEREGIQRQGLQLQNEIYIDKRGKRKLKVLKEGDKEVQVKFLDNNSVEQMPRDRFASYQRLEQYKDIPATELRKVYADNIRNLEKELGHSKEQKETNRALQVKDKVKSRKLTGLNSTELRDLTIKLETESKVRKAVTELETKGILHSKPRYSMFLDQMLPAPVNKLLDVIRPARNQGSVDPIRRIYVAKVDKFVVDQRSTLSEVYDLMSRAGFNSEKPKSNQVKSLSKAMNL